MAPAGQQVGGVGARGGGGWLGAASGWAGRGKPARPRHAASPRAQLAGWAAAGHQCQPPCPTGPAACDPQHCLGTRPHTAHALLQPGSMRQLASLPASQQRSQHCLVSSKLALVKCGNRPDSLVVFAVQLVGGWKVPSEMRQSTCGGGARGPAQEGNEVAALPQQSRREHRRRLLREERCARQAAACPQPGPLAHPRLLLVR